MTPRRDYVHIEVFFGGTRQIKRKDRIKGKASGNKSGERGIITHVRGINIKR